MDIIKGFAAASAGNELTMRTCSAEWAGHGPFVGWWPYVTINHLHKSDRMNFCSGWLLLLHKACQFFSSQTEKKRGVEEIVEKPRPFLNFPHRLFPYCNEPLFSVALNLDYNSLQHFQGRIAEDEKYAQGIWYYL